VIPGHLARELDPLFCTRAWGAIEILSEYTLSFLLTRQMFFHAYINMIPLTREFFPKVLSDFQNFSLKIDLPSIFFDEEIRQMIKQLVSLFQILSPLC
jgi:hypothetical protein